MLVTDNGSVFTSAEFKQFLKQNGIRHITSAPYHPASNGLAERTVQTFKESLCRNTEGSMDTRISRFLLQYRCTPHSTTGISPAELLFGRRPRTLLDLIVPDVSEYNNDKNSRRLTMTNEQKEDNLKMMTWFMFESFYLARIGCKEKLLKFLALCPTKFNCLMELKFNSTLITFIQD